MRSLGGLCELLEPEIRPLTLLLWTLWLNFGFVYYGVVIGMTELFDDIESTDDGQTCHGFNFPLLFVISAAEGVGDIAALLMVDSVGRKPVAAGFYLLLVAVLAPLAIVNTANTSVSLLLLLAATARAANGAGSSVCWVLTPELMPTRLRGRACGVCQAFNAAGNIVCCFWMYDSPFTLKQRIGLVMVSALICAICIILIPRETSGTMLDDKSAKKSPSRDAASAASFKESAAQPLLST